MSQIALKDVDIEFPMLHMEHRSLKKRILATATGGRIITSPGHVPMIRALTGVSMQLNAGDRVGLIGRNGAGKTTLLRTLAGVYEPIRGTIVSQGRIHSMLDAGLQLDMTGYENIRLRGQLLGLGREEMQEATAEIEAFTELGEFMRLPIRIYSTGMSMRLAFAMATIGKADILLQCASGLQALATVASAIKSGYYDIAIAAGVESMSQVPRNPGPLSPNIKECPLAVDCMLSMGYS